MILVTGGFGMIGAHTARYRVSSGRPFTSHDVAAAVAHYVGWRSANPR